MASLLGNYASSSSEEDAPEEASAGGPAVRRGEARGGEGEPAGVPEALPEDLKRPRALAVLAGLLEHPQATEIRLPWKIGPAGNVEALVAAAQKFTRDVAEGRQAPGVA